MYGERFSMEFINVNVWVSYTPLKHYSFVEIRSFVILFVRV